MTLVFDLTLARAAEITRPFGWIRDAGIRYDWSATRWADRIIEFHGCRGVPQTLPNFVRIGQ